MKDVERCSRCGKIIKDFDEHEETFLEYMKDEHGIIDAKYPDFSLCYSCAIDVYEERLMKEYYGENDEFRLKREEKEKPFDPSDDYWYDE